jgi:hypothetical protein
VGMIVRENGRRQGTLVEDWKSVATKGVTGAFSRVAGKELREFFRLREKLVGCRRAYRARCANHKDTVPRKLLRINENRRAICYRYSGFLVLTGHHSPGGATPPGTSGGSFSTISSERPNSSMRDVLRSASVGSFFVSVPSAATRNLLFRPMVRIVSTK